MIKSNIQKAKDEYYYAMFDREIAERKTLNVSVVDIIIIVVFLAFMAWVANYLYTLIL